MEMIDRAKAFWKNLDDDKLRPRHLAQFAQSELDRLEWVEIEDRSPDEAGHYLTALANGHTHFAYYGASGEWRSADELADSFLRQHIVAWMPIPPYQPQGEV